MSERRCETCRWWSRYFGDQGVCSKIGDGGSDKAAIQFTSYVEIADPELLTAPDFFCALHKEKA